MSNKFEFNIFKSSLLKLENYRHHRLECSVSRSASGEHFISIGDASGWIHGFCTAMIGSDCEKLNNCLCWECSPGIFRAVYIDTFCKFGDIILYSTATHSSKEKASIYAVDAWRRAKKEIIKIADNELDKERI